MSRWHSYRGLLENMSGSFKWLSKKLTWDLRVQYRHWYSFLYIICPDESCEPVDLRYTSSQGVIYLFTLVTVGWIINPLATSLFNIVVLGAIELLSLGINLLQILQFYTKLQRNVTICHMICLVVCIELARSGSDNRGDIFILYLTIIITSEASIFPIFIRIFRGCVSEVVALSYSVSCLISIPEKLGFCFQYHRTVHGVCK